MAIEDVLELCPDLKVILTFLAHAEVPAKIHRLCRLPLPAVAVIEWRRGPVLPRRSIGPSRRVQNQLLRGIKMAVRIDQEFRHIRIGVIECMPPAPESWVVRRPDLQFTQEVVVGRGRLDEGAALISQQGTDLLVAQYQ